MGDQGQPTEAPDSSNALHDALEAIGLSLPCQRPVSAVRTNTLTGESEEILIRCNTRKARVCPSCAALYRGDVNAIMREGIQTAAAEDDAVVFLTVTAPSFGKIHHVPRPAPPRLSARKRAAWDRRRQRRCACGSRHTQGDKRYAGVPVSPGEYDYAGQVRFNLAAGRLWSRTADELTRILDVREPARFNEETQRWNKGRRIRLPYVATAEWQSRGAIHLHVIARIPRALLNSLDPYESRERGSTRLARLEREVTDVTTTVDGETFRWGTECVAEVVNNERSMIRTAGYLAKLVGYAVKDLTSDLGAKSAHAPEVKEHHRRLSAGAERLRCGERPSTGRNGEWTAEEERWLQCDTAQMIGRRDGRYGCRSLRHSQWGWRGHTVRRSRSWSVLNMTGCRSARRKFHDIAHPDEPSDLPDDEDTTEDEVWAWEVVEVTERYDWERWQERLL